MANRVRDWSSDSAGTGGNPFRIMGAPLHGQMTLP
jgi:hypothetical protein